MQLLSNIFAILLSSGASSVLGSNVRGAKAEKEHSKLSALRRLMKDPDTIPGDETKALKEVKAGSGGRQRGGGSHYSKYWNKGCRNRHGGKGSSHYDFDLYRHVTKSWCEHKCDSLGHSCYGYEFGHGKCEVWRVPIYYVEYVHGLDCHVKY